MDNEKLSKRLQTVADFIPTGAVLADIGSDHAYLPVALCLQNKITSAVAGEVVEGPFHAAEKNIANAGLTEKIKVRLADGLAAVEAEDHVTAISICGMGGQLIADILERGKQAGQLSGLEVLILQPNVGEFRLRKWLMENQYLIINEAIIEEGTKIYEIIVAMKSAESVKYSAKELLFGVELSIEKNAVFTKKWQQNLVKVERVLTQLEQAQEPQKKKIKALQKERKAIKEMLK